MPIQVSVIIPVYNVEDYLAQCLESVLNQTFGNIEIIIVNDGSKDNSDKIIEKYEKSFPEIIKVICQENSGLSVARNVALDEARGEYVIFVDSDDYIGSGFVECLYNKALETDSDMVICNYTKVTDKGEILREYEANYVYKGVRIPSYISCNRIVRRSLYEKYNIRYKKGIICEDIPVTLKLEAVAKNIQIISDSEYYYRTNPQSITSTFKKRKLLMNQLPFEALKESVEFSMMKEHVLPYEQLEFFVCRIWTSLIFDIGKGCDKDVRKGMCREVMLFMKQYFPSCYKNTFIKFGDFSGLPIVQVIGTWVFVHSLRYRLLPIVAKLYSVL